MFIRQTFRIYPNKEQQQTLIQWIGQGRFVWNKMLEMNIETYKEKKEFVFAYDMHKRLPDLKSEFEWLKECPSQVLQQKCQDLGTALSFKKNNRGFPKFKSKATDTSGIRFPQSVKLEGNRVKVPKIKSGIKIKLHQEILGKRGAATVYKNRADQWFISFVVEIADVEPLKEIKNIVGIDLGLKEFLISSDGEVVKNPRFLRKSEKKLKREQRRLSRKQKGSNNRNKARLKVAKVHNHIKNQRKDFINKTASSIAKNYDLVLMEDLNVKGMIQNHKLAKSISDVSWSMFVNTLEWQCKKRGKYLQKIGRFYPSSKTCNSCGHKKTDLGLDERVYNCSNCRTSIDRDLNAALNIRDEGLREFQIRREPSKLTPVRYDDSDKTSGQEAVEPLGSQ